MRLKFWQLILAAVLVAACGRDTLDKPYPPVEQNTPQPEPQPEDAPRPVAAGQALSIWQIGDSDPNLAFDGQGQLNLFNKSANATTGASYNQRKLQADGTWTSPQKVTPDFQYTEALAVLSGSVGQPCLLWSGQLFDANGNSNYGLFRNCQKPDGSWPTSAEQPVVTPTPATFWPSLAPDGSLRAVYITRALLYYSPIDPPAPSTLTDKQLSGDNQALLARLVIDSKGVYHAAWTESTGGDSFTVQASDSRDGGATWAKTQQLFTGTANNPASISFQLVADAVGAPLGGAHLAWEDKDSIFYRHWTAESGWGEQVTLSGQGRNSAVALAVTKEGLAHAIWTTYGGQAGITLRVQSPGGEWEPPQTVSPLPARALTLALDAKGANYIVWNDDQNLRYLMLP